MPEVDAISLIGQLNALKSKLSQCQMEADEQGYAEQAASLGESLKYLRDLLKTLLDHAYQDLIAETHPLMVEVRAAQTRTAQAIESVNNQVQFAQNVVNVVGQVEQVIKQVRQYCHI
ncbi:MAG: hypothetical protein AB1439_05135 [candidate division FCPU426 bacterium]